MSGGGLTSEQMLANAGKSYDGPMGLGIQGIEDTYASTLAAQQNLDAIGSQEGLQSLVGGQEGNARLSGALIGNAGRKDFDALRARFNPDGDLDKAEKDAMAQATAARDTSKKNAAEWKTLGDQTKGEEDAEAARRKAFHQKQEDEAAQLEADKKWQADWNATDKGDGRLVAKSVFEYLDPLNYIGGGQRSAGMKFFGDLGHENYAGNISWLDNADDKLVYSQMDAAQWEELSRLTGPAQRNWINQRYAELYNKTGRPRGTYQSHK